jgi:transposase-like protein
MPLCGITETLSDVESVRVVHSRIDRDAALSRLKDRGLSIRQIERLTGINRNTIQRAK